MSWLFFQQSSCDRELRGGSDVIHVVQTLIGPLSTKIPGTCNSGTPYLYYSHTTPIRIPKDMGMVWE